MTLWLALPMAFALGLLHALDADHVIAVTTFIARRPGPREAAGFCLRWGLGHMVPLLVLAVGGILLGLRVPPAFGRAMEGVVGGTLILLGALVLRDLARRRIHLHAHARGGGHAHGHGPTLVGLLHGLAGTASIFVVVPVTVLASAWAAALSVALFSLAVLGMMLLYGCAAGTALLHLRRRSAAWDRLALAITGGLGVGTGGLWLARWL